MDDPNRLRVASSNRQLAFDNRFLFSWSYQPCAEVSDLEKKVARQILWCRTQLISLSRGKPDLASCHICRHDGQNCESKQIHSIHDDLDWFIAESRWR